MGHLCDSVDSRQWTGAAGYTATQQGGAGGGGPADDTCRYIRLNQGTKNRMLVASARLSGCINI